MSEIRNPTLKPAAFLSALNDGTLEGIANMPGIFSEPVRLLYQLF